MWFLPHAVDPGHLSQSFNSHVSILFLFRLVRQNISDVFFFNIFHSLLVERDVMPGRPKPVL